jgi:glycosyltransferase involved in cell wall biosynthesis
VLAQTMDDFELLLGDDCSSDSSRAILVEYGDPRVRVFLNDRNVGLFANLNRLTAHAAAPFVRFLCQDDALVPECLAVETEYLGANAKVVLAICSASQMDDKGREIGEWDVGPAPDAFSGAYCLQRLFYEGCLPGSLSTVTVRRAALIAAGPFDESFTVAGDYEMWVRVAQQGWVADLHIRLIRQREHDGRLSVAPLSGVRFVEENQRVVENLLRLLPAAIRAEAGRYFWWRQNVFDTNYFFHCLRKGRVAECGKLARVMGGRRLIRGIAAWLITVNNRVYRPTPVFAPE